MTEPIGTKLNRVIARNPYTVSERDEIEDYLVENEGTMLGWYWTQNGERVSFGSCRKTEKKLKLPAYDWKKENKHNKQP